ncbi:unnamed protein product [Pocillopora meandrina]|uniref:Uncharacterized protein n=1 Tax=Pocillopora meandrina TaxID=46732 RepID=A0AAU9VUH4_9CNID|nr:unnamed protein product [Pocillopora meandrina]
MKQDQSLIDEHVNAVGKEDSSVKTPGKQFNPKIIFSDLKESYFTKLRRQLNIGATYNVMGSVT